MDRAGRETRLTITHLQGNLPAQVLVQLFDAYSRCVWNAGFQIAGHGDVMCATVQVILKADSALGRVSRKKKKKKNHRSSSYLKSVQRFPLMVQVIALVVGAEYRIIGGKRRIMESVSLAFQVRPVQVSV